MHDAVLCAEAGVPAVVVVTEPFLELAKVTAANLGMPGFPVLVVEHPLFTRDQQWLESNARRLADEIANGELAVVLNAKTQ